MTVKMLAERLSLKACCVSNYEREVTGCYTGDLLSHVMVKMPKGSAWVTVMTNINVVAVALMTEASCVIVSENAEIDDDTLRAANEKGINFFVSAMTSYELCSKISEILV